MYFYNLHKYKQDLKMIIFIFIRYYQRYQQIN